MMTLCFFVVLMFLSFDFVFSRQSFFSVSLIVLEFTVDQAGTPSTSQVLRLKVPNSFVFLRQLSIGWLAGTCCVNWDSFKLRDPLASASGVLELKACCTVLDSAFASVFKLCRQIQVCHFRRQRSFQRLLRSLRFSLQCWFRWGWEGTNALPSGND